MSIKHYQDKKVTKDAAKEAFYVFKPKKINNFQSSNSVLYEVFKLGKNKTP